MDFTTTIAPVTLVLVEILKSLGVPTKYLSLIAVIAGGLLGALYAIFNSGDVFTLTVDGILSGAASSGLYEVVNRNLLTPKQK